MRVHRWLALHLLLCAVFLSFAAADTAGQSGLPSDDRHGKDGTWDVGGKKTPPTDDENENFWASQGKKSLREIKCYLREVADLGRIYVEDASGGAPYWIQLPDSVKLRAASKADFDGRKKLKLEDLEAGQRLELTLRKKSDEVMIVRVRRP